MPTIAELINSYKAETGDSFEKIAARAGIPKATLTWMAARGDQLTVTEPERVQALADGLRLPLREVQLAAIESAGLMPDSLALTHRAVIVSRQLDALPASDWRLVRALIDRLTDG